MINILLLLAGFIPIAVAATWTLPAGWRRTFVVDGSTACFFGVTTLGAAWIAENLIFAHPVLTDPDLVGGREFWRRLIAAPVEEVLRIVALCLIVRGPPAPRPESAPTSAHEARYLGTMMGGWLGMAESALRWLAAEPASTLAWRAAVTVPLHMLLGGWAATALAQRGGEWRWVSPLLTNTVIHLAYNGAGLVPGPTGGGLCLLAVWIALAGWLLSGDPEIAGPPAHDCRQ